MSWVSTLESAGHLGEAVTHFNEALDLLERDGTEVDATRYLSDALNKIQTEWSLLDNVEMGEVKTFQTMLQATIDPEDQATFLCSDDVGCLLRLEPRIMNHDVLKRNGYRPGVGIDAKLVKKASEVHRQAQSALAAFRAGETEETRARLLNELDELLYIVSSNIAHGEKTSRGQDYEKDKRDKAVSKLVIPVQLRLIKLVLDRPDERLVVYGTLAPGQPNHRIIEDLDGDISGCYVSGHVIETDGLPFFTWGAATGDVKAQLLRSRQLPDMWESLDRFEGGGYKRRLIPATTGSGLLVASIYVSTADDWWS